METSADLLWLNDLMAIFMLLKRLTVERLSDADVVDLISALGEGKILTELR